jgi:hypothetical protein
MVDWDDLDMALFWLGLLTPHSKRLSRSSPPRARGPKKKDAHIRQGLRGDFCVTHNVDL